MNAPSAVQDEATPTGSRAGSPNHTEQQIFTLPVSRPSPWISVRRPLGPHFATRGRWDSSACGTNRAPSIIGAEDDAAKEETPRYADINTHINRRGHPRSL